MSLAPKTIISDDAEWVATISPRHTPEGWLVGELTIRSTDGRASLDLRDTGWDCHQCKAIGGANFEVWVHHPLDAAHERRVMVWPPGNASLADFSQAQAPKVVRDWLVELAGVFAQAPARAAHEEVPAAVAASGPDRFYVNTDDYFQGERVIRRATIVEKSPARDHQFTAGTMWETALAPIAPGEFAFTVKHAQMLEAACAGLVSANVLRVLVQGAAGAIRLDQFRAAIVQFERDRDLAGLRKALTLDPPPEVPPDVKWAGPCSRYTFASVASEVGPHQWGVAPRIFDRLTGEVLLDLAGTMWDGTPEVDESSTVSLDLRHYPEGGEFLSLEMDLACGLASLRGDRRRFPLAWLNRCLNTYHAYERMETLKLALVRCGVAKDHPEIRLFSQAMAYSVELWALKGEHAGLDVLTPRITDRQGRVMLDLRETPWAADVSVSRENTMVTLELMRVEKERVRGLYLHGCYVDLMDRRFRGYASPGGVAMARLQTLLASPLERDELQQRLEAELVEGVAWPAMDPR